MTAFLIKMALRNTLRHKLRAGLTLLGIVIAILAFGLLRTVVSAWYAGADAASDKRLITRNAISLVFPLPISYAEKIRKIDGVTGVTWSNWFAGVYIEEKNFFPQFGVEPDSFLKLYPEFVVDEEARKAFILDQQGALVGRKLANRYGWKVGDSIPLKGTIYPGTYRFTIRAIYDGRTSKVDTNQFLFHWKLLNERIKVLYPRRGDNTGIFIIGIRDGQQAAAVSQAVDREFRNSLAETLTETEKAFQLSFVSMTETIVVAIKVVSFVVIVIIMAVMANTMAMSARERTAEYATLKALGFGPPVVGLLIVTESLVLTVAGGALGAWLTWPVSHGVAKSLDNIFPIFDVAPSTVLWQMGCAVVVGLVAAALPAWRAMRGGIVEGLRSIA